MATSLGSLTGFSLLLSAVPMYATSAGWGAAGAGLSTGVLLAGTVLLELAVPRLVARLGYRVMMAVGMILLGIPGLALIRPSSIWTLLAVGLLRGAGLGIVVVVGPALVADLVPSEHHGSGLGRYGFAVGLPPIIGLPLGVWLASRIGFTALFLVAAAFTLAALPAVAGLPSTAPPADPAGNGIIGLLRCGSLARLTAVFGAITLAAGVFVTFLPLATTDGRSNIAAAGLLAQSVAAPVARWFAGRFGDRYGSRPLLIPAVLAAAVGAACVVHIGQPLAVVTGMGLFGVGFGLAQNVTLTLMFVQVTKATYGRVSALWNIAYDAGMGAGALGIGFLATRTGYRVALALTAMVTFLALVPAWLDRTQEES